MKDLDGSIIHTYAIMVHRIYRDRVLEYLNGDENDNNSKTRGPAHPSMSSTSTQPRFVLANEQVQQVTKGVSRAKRGFTLLIVAFRLPQFCSISNLSPFARQNISWFGKLQYSSVVNSMKLNKDMLQRLLSPFQKLPQCPTAMNNIRLQVHPSDHDLTYSICQQLQQFFDPTVQDPFETSRTPISFTLSKTLCTHRMTIVFLPVMIVHEDNNIVSSSSFHCYAGVESSDDANSIGLNHQAHDEIIVQACTRDNEEMTSCHPVSRAYYKLEQVFREYIHPGREPFVCTQSSELPHSSLIDHLSQHTAIDMGAAPGGFTQVLVQIGCMNKVMAVDPAQLHPRVMNAPEVQHVKACLADANDLQNKGPYSIFVCDASIIWNRVFEEYDLCKSLSKLQFVLPCVFVITLKMPFKSLGSIQHHVEMMHKRVPEYMEKLAATLFQGQATTLTWKIAHLMANSDRERTLLAFFQRKM